MTKIRVNITVDKENLDKAKTKLKFFGGKISTLFDAYLADFVSSMDKDAGKGHEDLMRRVKELEDRISRIEKRK
jgi:hypothetical protein